MKKIIVHYVVEAVVDFVYGRLSNPYAQGAVAYITHALDAALKDKENTHVFVFQRDKHEATKEEYLLSNEGKNFPFFHCPDGDPGMEVVPELRRFEKYAYRLSPVDKEYIFDPITVCTLRDVEADIGRIDEIHFYGFLTGMCVVGAAIQTRANFQDADTDIFVHARGTADCDRPDAIGEMRPASEYKNAALLTLQSNFIKFIP